MENRKKLQHLRGTGELTIEKAKSVGFSEGEIAIKHGDTTNPSEIYVLSADGNSLDVFVSKAYVDSKIFVGSQEQYDKAYAAGKIALGAIVIITDDDVNADSAGTTAVLGKAVLGQLVLGKE